MRNVFIDLNYVRSDIKECFDRVGLTEQFSLTRMNWMRISGLLGAGRLKNTNIRYHLFDAPPPSANSEKSREHSYIASLPFFHIHLGTPNTTNDKEKGVDTLLSIEALEAASHPKCEEIVLVCRDLDFEPLARSLRRKQVSVFLRYFKRCAPALRIAADETTRIRARNILQWSDFEEMTDLPGHAAGEDGSEYPILKSTGKGREKISIRKRFNGDRCLFIEGPAEKFVFVGTDESLEKHGPKLKRFISRDKEGFF